jgi:hypothetical protein
MDYQKKFNQTFGEMLSDLLTVFPGDAELKMYQLAVQAALMADPDIVRRMLHDHVSGTFGDQLLARNDAFFLSHDYSQLVDGDSTALKVVEKLKNCWGKLSADNQAAMWRYFHVLVVLDRKLTA